MEEFSAATHKPQNIAIKDIIKQISNGFTLQNVEDITLLEEELKLELSDSIIIAPDYQRDYRSSIIDESSLIESLLVGIPIPPVFLANDRFEGLQVLNVVDGQHRLRAFYRFKENKFSLSGLKLLNSLNGSKFNDLDFDTKQKILTHKLAAIVFTDFPGLDFELEIFNRYNKGTKPLTPQEIRHAVYNSNLNNYVNKFAKDMVDNKTSKELQNAYNATKDRYQKKKVQESIFVLMNILESGINESYSKSSIYAEEYMKQKSQLEKNESIYAHDNFLFVKDSFENFNKIIELIGKRVEFPFSKEIYGISSRNYKFQVSIGMLLAGIFHRMISYGISLEVLDDEFALEKFLDYVSNLFKHSYLEDPEYNASSTNPKKMRELINIIDLEELFN
ncbi:DUF262 domain-containing protein [Alkalicoccobacillus murimartini]|uniref:GmrSD restriction endonucleases N-terminal domain-containing protein n=1 Tax=Alkalicoccobacillus murimartini TaxID=171685 RepID=A0ABT9YMK8_9BACI|nr:DUF262 domain-containing protein [Alkalicoccobacillus murimartini]MDQ0209090.1 hypothetical protein [Alkalicoccobacillus murimartini]